MPGTYTHMIYKCPFFTFDERSCVHCEQGSRVKFKDIKTIRDYERKYCASMNYEGCSIARALMEEYERKDDEKIREEETRKAAETAETGGG